jgi:hypothetical protein
MFTPTFRRREVLFVLLTAGCATTRYPTSDVGSAILESSRTVIESIDDQNVRAGGPDDSVASFEIPAGRHRVEVGLPTVSTATPRPADKGKAIAVCFVAVAGRRYVTRPIFERDRWRPVIVDVSARVVSSACTDTYQAIPATNDQVAVASASRVGQAGPSSLPLPQRAQLRDPKLPGSGLTAGVGFFGGGDSLYRVKLDTGQDRVLNAGRGVLVTVGALWTPLWAPLWEEDQLGLGLGASVGWKYDAISASNGEVSLTRFPLTATAHALIRLNKKWFTLVSGGLTKELGGKLSGSGFAAKDSASFTGTLGPLCEGGLYFTIGPVTLGAAVRYSSSSTQWGFAEADASSLGIIAASQYRF